MQFTNYKYYTLRNIQGKININLVITAKLGPIIKNKQINNRHKILSCAGII